MNYIKDLFLKLTVGFILICSAQMVNAQLVTSTGETLVNTTYTDSTQQNCAVSMDTSGRYVVVWESIGNDGDGFGIFAKIYNADHSVRVPDFEITTTSDDRVNDQRFPDVAMNAEGTWCVTWQSQEDEGYNTNSSEWVHQGWDVYRRIFDIDGNIVSSKSRVNSTTAGNQMHPAVAAGDDMFVVTFASEVAGTDESQIYVRPFLKNGANVNAIQLVYSLAGSHLTHPDVAMAPTSEYTVTWQADSIDGDRNGVFYASYDDSYNQIIASTQVNTTIAGNQQEPRIAVDENGEFMIVWSSFDQDGDHYGIYGQRYSAPGTTSGGEIAITTNTAGSQDHAAIAASREGGKYVITWTDDTAEGDRLGVYSRTMYSNGSFLDNDVLINTTTANYQLFSDVAIGNDVTEAVFAWQSGLRQGFTSQADPDYFGIYAEGFVVEDITPPVANCQNINVYLDGTGNVSITGIELDNGSTDNIGIVSMIASNSAFTCANLGANTSTLTVFDAEGLSDACISTITVLDTVSPVAVCQNITVYLNGAGTVSWAASELDGGSTDNCSSIAFSANITSATCADVGANAITFTVTDNSGNSNTCTSTVTVLDTISPNAICQNVTAYIDGSGNATITGIDIDGGSTDNCSGTLMFIPSATAFTCADIGANSVTLTVTDQGGNSATCDAIVTIEDTISPVAVCQNTTVFLDASGNGSITVADVDNGSSDNCGTPTLSIDLSVFDCSMLGANTVTLTATDASGNTNTCTSTVNVVDNTPPVVICQDLTVYLDGTGSVTIAASEIDGGSSDVCSNSLSLTADITSFTCANTGANSVTLLVDDGNGNSDVCTATVTVLDTISPVVVCQDITVYLDGTGNVSISSSEVDGGSSDNCGIATLDIDVSAFTCANTGPNSVTLTGTDANGNSNSCTSTVTVLDTISPVVVCQDVTVYLDGTGNISITTADVDNGSSDNCGSPTLAIDLNTFDCSMIGPNTVNLTATDASGNTNTCTSTITVADTTSPIVVCQDITVYLDGAGSASIVANDIDGGSTDNCSTLLLSPNITSFTCADVGANAVTLTGTDGNGNTSICTATVTILDSISPVVICQDITVYLDATGNVSISSSEVDGGSSDNCGIATLDIDVSAFTCANTGPNSVILSATDAAGNANMCTATVTVLDTISPVVVCQDVTVYLDGTGNATITSAEVDGGSTDNCGTPTLIIDLSVFDCSMIGANTVNLTATDADGNTNACAATVTILDTVSPVVVCQDITVNLDGTGNASITSADVDNGSADNCSSTAVIDVTTFDCSNIGANLVTLTLTDPSGNVSSCVATVTVADIISPTASALAPATVECIGEIPVDINIVLGAADNCTAVPTVTWTSDVSDGLTCPETITRTYTVSDASGNTFDVVQTITVQDLTPPTASNPLGLSVQCAADIPLADITLVTDEADNCGAPIVTWVGDVSDGLSCPETITRTFNVADICGNSIDVVQMITVLDIDAPTADITILPNETSNCDFTPTPPTATDNCSGLITGVSDVVFPITVFGTTTVTWSFTDDCGNVSSQTQDVILSPIDVSVSMGTDGITMIATNTGQTYQWIDCLTDQPVPGETSNSFTPTYGSDYAVIITVGGCSDTSECVKSTVGIDPISFVSGLELVIFPNPTSGGEFTVQLEGEWIGEVTVEMVDSRGRLIYKDLTSSKVLNVKLDELETGTYFIRAKDENQNVLTTRLVTVNK